MKLDADKNIRAIEKNCIAAAEIASHHLRDLILQQNREQFCFEFGIWLSTVRDNR